MVCDNSYEAQLRSKTCDFFFFFEVNSTKMSRHDAEKDSKTKLAPQVLFSTLKIYIFYSNVTWPSFPFLFSNFLLSTPHILQDMEKPKATWDPKPEQSIIYMYKWGLLLSITIHYLCLVKCPNLGFIMTLKNRSNLQNG